MTGVRRGSGAGELDHLTRVDEARVAGAQGRAVRVAHGVPVGRDLLGSRVAAAGRLVAAPSCAAAMTQRFSPGATTWTDAARRRSRRCRRRGCCRWRGGRLGRAGGRHRRRAGRRRTGRSCWPGARAAGTEPRPARPLRTPFGPRPRTSGAVVVVVVVVGDAGAAEAAGPVRRGAGRERHRERRLDQASGSRHRRDRPGPGAPRGRPAAATRRSTRGATRRRRGRPAAGSRRWRRAAGSREPSADVRAPGARTPGPSRGGGARRPRRPRRRRAGRHGRLDGRSWPVRYVRFVPLGETVRCTAVSTRLLLVRHARPTANWNDHPDSGLDATGREQAAALAADLGPTGRGPSSRRRCSGRGRRRPRSRRGGGSSRRSGPTVGEIPSPGAEVADRGAWLREVLRGRWADVDARVARWRERLLAALVGFDDGTVVVTHFVAINAAVGSATGNDRIISFTPDHCSRTELAVERRTASRSLRSVTNGSRKSGERPADDRAREEAVAEARRIFSVTPLHRLLGITVREPDGSGVVVAEMPVRPEAFNMSGNLHGGALATLIDVAGGSCAAPRRLRPADPEPGDRGPPRPVPRPPQGRHRPGRGPRPAHRADADRGRDPGARPARQRHRVGRLLGHGRPPARAAAGRPSSDPAAPDL